MKNKKVLKVLSSALLIGATIGALGSCKGPSTTTPNDPTLSVESSSKGTTPVQGGSTTSGQTTPLGPTPTSGQTTPSEEVQKNAIEMNGTAYETLAAAFAAIPKDEQGTYTIKLNKGTYNVVGLNYNGSATIRIVGNTNTKYGADVIIKGRGSNMSSMKTREMIEIQGTGNIILENVSLVSDYSRSETTKDAQAEVLGTDTTGKTVAYNCSFISHQDTLRTAGKAWFYGCYVEGDTDFIWMEATGSVALYEKCEIVSVYDENASTHQSYIAAPRMNISSKAGKGLVFYNSTVRESDEAKEKGQKTYLARTPWTSGYYNQVAYINTQISDVEENVWYKSSIANDFAETIIGWKMDKVSANSMGITTGDYIIDDESTSKEFNGRNAILNRIYNTSKQRYEEDSENLWDINSLISEYKYNVDADSSKSLLDGETASQDTIYNFDGSEDQSSYCNGFAKQDGKSHYYGKSGATITIPVNGKAYITVYGYYAGTAEIKADSSNDYSVMFFNNGSTSKFVENTYIVTDANAKEVVITAKDTTYITKIVVSEDSNIPDATKVNEITISKSSSIEIVGVALTLSASVNSDATNKNVVWSSSDESIASIDKYTGKITFKTAGEVTFTATACDGSGVTQTITCNPINSNWQAVEFYTIDSKLDTDDGASGYNYFSTNDSAYKSLGTSYTFKNLAGEEITTSNGFKLNSSGKLSIATTKKATLTLITCDVGKVFATPVVSSESGTIATLVSTNVSDDGKVYTYVYTLTEAGMWNIVRGDNSSENNPLLYAKCEYADSISSSCGVSFKGTTYTVSNTEIANDNINYPQESIDASSSIVEINGFKLENCKSNDSASNWLVFKNNATITFKVSGPCTLLVGYYGKLQTVILNDTEVTGDKDSVTNGQGEIVKYVISEAGTVVITATNADYLGFVGVVFAD